MADVRRRAGLLALILVLAAGTGCAGVPKSGAVHRLDPPADQAAGAGVAQAAQGPRPHQTGIAVVQAVLDAMTQHDINVVEQYLTPDYAPQWFASSTSQTVVYKQQGSPALNGSQSQISVGLTQIGVIDSTQTFDATPASLGVTFSLAQNKGTFQVSAISPKGLFVSQGDLPDVLTPWHIYFPSSAASSATVRRLVPDTVFLPPDSSPYNLITQLLDGPSEWVKPAVYVTVPPGQNPKVNQVTPSTRNALTTVDLHLPGKRLSAQYLATLKAQIAYTLNVQSFHTGSIQLLLDGVPAGGAYTLAQLAKGYDPDVLPAQAPVYYISGDQQVVASTPGSQTNVAGGASGVPAVATPDTVTVVLEHADGVQQLAVAAPTEENGVETQLLAGVRSDHGVPGLELTTATNPDLHPWTAVTMPQQVKALSTPSFDVTGSGVWTVATAPDGTTTIYRVPLMNGVPGTPVQVTATLQGPGGSAHVSTLKLSRDGSRAAVIVKGQAYVGVVNHPTTAIGTWSITSLRPAIQVADPDTDVDVVWADQSELGVVVQNRATKTTNLYRVSSDGYTVSADGSIGPVAIDGAPGDATVYVAGGPRQPWVASVDGRLTRQSTSDSSSDPTSATPAPWVGFGDATGYYPTYAG